MNAVLIAKTVDYDGRTYRVDVDGSWFIKATSRQHNGPTFTWQPISKERVPIVVKNKA